MSDISHNSTIKSTHRSILKKGRFENISPSPSHTSLLENSLPNLPNNQQNDFKQESHYLIKCTFLPHKQIVSKKISQPDSNNFNLLDPDKCVQLNKIKQISFKLQNEICEYRVERNNRHNFAIEDDELDVNVISEGLEDGSTDEQQVKQSKVSKIPSKKIKECCQLF